MINGDGDGSSRIHLGARGNALAGHAALTDALRTVRGLHVHLETAVGQGCGGGAFLQSQHAGNRDLFIFLSKADQKCHRGAGLHRSSLPGIHADYPANGHGVTVISGNGGGKAQRFDLGLRLRLGQSHHCGHCQGIGTRADRVVDHGAGIHHGSVLGFLGKNGSRRLGGLLLAGFVSRKSQLLQQAQTIFLSLTHQAGNRYLSVRRLGTGVFLFLLLHLLILSAASAEIHQAGCPGNEENQNTNDNGSDDKAADGHCLLQLGADLALVVIILLIVFLVRILVLFILIVIIITVLPGILFLPAGSGITGTAFPDGVQLFVGQHHRLGMAGQRRQVYKITVGVQKGMFQVLNQLRHIAVTPVRTFLRTLQNNLLQAVGKIRHIFFRGFHLFLQMLDGDGHRGVPVKGNVSRHHLIHGDSKGIDITLGVAESSAHLLRRAVVHRPHHIGADGVGGRCPGDAEIRQLHLSVHGNDNVLRLYIPVNDVVFVCRLKAQGNLDGDAGGLPHGQFTLPCDIILQGNALYQFHDDIVNAIVLPYVIDIYHIGMSQPRGRLRLLAELRDEILIFAELRFHDLHCYETVQLMIAGLVHVGHAAAADPADDLISFSYNHALF